MTYSLIRLILATIFIISAFKWGDWKNWKKYYPTMLFLGMADLIHCVVFYDKPLWKFQPDIINHSINELFVIFTVFFSTALLFLSNFPKKLFHQTIYISLWAVIYICIELFTTSIRMQKNFNGWNIWYSLLYDIFLFSILIIHHKRPIIAWVITLVFGVAIMIKFNVPILL